MMVETSSDFCSICAVINMYTYNVIIIFVCCFLGVFFLFLFLFLYFLHKRLFYVVHCLLFMYILLVLLYTE